MDTKWRERQRGRRAGGRRERVGSEIEQKKQRELKYQRGVIHLSEETILNIDPLASVTSLHQMDEMNH